MVLGQRSLPCREDALMRFHSPPQRSASFEGEKQSIRCHISRLCAPRWSCSRPRASATMKLPRTWVRAARLSACGGNAFSRNGSPDWKNALVRDGPEDFPPELVIQVKAPACEPPATHDLPLSRWSTTDLAQYVTRSGLIAQISGSTIWRWLHEDAIRPWQH